jgi:hypothetical protein
VLFCASKERMGIMGWTLSYTEYSLIRPSQEHSEKTQELRYYSHSAQSGPYPKYRSLEIAH